MLQTTNILGRLKAYATEKGWDYESPEDPKLAGKCVMYCAKGHRIELPVTFFLFPPTADCPACVRILHPALPDDDDTPAGDRPPKPPKPPKEAGGQGGTRLLGTEEAKKRILKGSHVNLLSNWAGVERMHDFGCPTCDAHWSELGMKQLTGKAGCPYCKPRRVRAGLTPLEYTFPNGGPKTEAPA